MNQNYEITYYEVNSTTAVEMPSHIPLGFNPSAEDFDWSEVYPDNYWSMALIKEMEAAGKPLPVVTPSHIKYQPVYDPEQPPNMRDMRPKIVLYFKENVPALVMNKSRSQLASDMTGYRNPSLWVPNLPILELSRGELNNRLQIIFNPASLSSTETKELAAAKKPAESNPDPAEDINQLLGLDS